MILIRSPLIRFFYISSSILMIDSINSDCVFTTKARNAQKKGAKRILFYMVCHLLLTDSRYIERVCVCVSPCLLINVGSS